MFVGLRSTIFGKGCRRLGLVSAVALALSGPAYSAECVTGNILSAARVVELKTVLMSVSLRCHMAGNDISQGYNMFVMSNHRAITSAHETLEAFFRASGLDPRVELDSFNTNLANLYGGGRTTRETCAAFGAISKEAIDASGNPEALARVAERVVRAPHLPQRACQGANNGVIIAAH